MFPIPLPWLIVGVMVALFGTYRGGYHFGNTGRLRLPTASCPQASTSSPPATGDSRADASELERQTIATLIDIVAEGDKAIVKHTACVAAYNEMRELVNGNK